MANSMASEGEFRRRDATQREPEGRDDGHTSSRHAALDDDEIEVAPQHLHAGWNVSPGETVRAVLRSDFTPHTPPRSVRSNLQVGCHGARRSGEAGKGRQRLFMAIGLVVASAVLLVPVVMGLIGSELSPEDPAAMAEMRLPNAKALGGKGFTDNLNSDQDCSFEKLSAWASDRGIETGKIQVADLECVQCEGGKRRGVIAKERIAKGEAIVRAPWAATVTAEFGASAELAPAMRLLKNATRLSPLDALALVLVFERFRPASPLSPFICFLPKAHESPIFWEDSRVAALDQPTRKGGESAEIPQRVSFFKHRLLERSFRVKPSCLPTYLPTYIHT